MTDQEKREQRGRLLVDLEDAKSDLASLQEKAVRMSEEMKEAATTVRRNADLQPSGEELATGGAAENRLGQEYQSLPAYIDLIKLIQALRAARQKVYSLELRKARLEGSPIPLPPAL